MSPTTNVINAAIRFFVEKYTNKVNITTTIKTKIMLEFLVLGSARCILSIRNIKSSTENDITAEVTWFSVKLDTNNPREIKVAPSKNMPMYPVKISDTETVPNLLKIKGYKTVIKSEIVKIAKAAKYLPSTMSDIFKGEVNKSWSVLFLVSSDIIFMVNIGIMNRKIIIRLWSVPLYAGLEDSKLYIVKKIPVINRNVPMKI